jgi:hypothetical protein
MSKKVFNVVDKIRLQLQKNFKKTIETYLLNQLQKRQIKKFLVLFSYFFFLKITVHNLYFIFWLNEKIQI